MSECEKARERERERERDERGGGREGHTDRETVTDCSSESELESIFLTLELIGSMQHTKVYKTNNGVTVCHRFCTTLPKGRE